MRCMKYHFHHRRYTTLEPSKISKSQHAAYTHTLIQCKGNHARGYADANAMPMPKNERPNKRPNETPMVMIVTLRSVWFQASACGSRTVQSKNEIESKISQA